MTMTKAETDALNTWRDNVARTWRAIVPIARQAIAEGVSNDALALALSYTNHDYIGLRTSQYTTALWLMPYAGPHAGVIAELVSAVLANDRAVYPA